jgi:hypothetical protein
MKITEFFKKLLVGNTKYDDLIEGMYAHNYTNESVRQQIAQDYKKKFTPVVSPLTNPEQYDPLNPPKGWMYDPYYEMWIER